MKPKELDVPHWAHVTVGKYRAEAKLPERVTDRMIYARIQEMRDRTGCEILAAVERLAVETEPKTINVITRADVDVFRTVQRQMKAEHNTLYDTINQYQEIAAKSAIYPGKGTPLGLIYCGLKLNGEAGEFAEHVGKAMRDDGFATDRGSVEYRTLSDARRAAIKKELGDVLWYVSAAAKELGYTLGEIAVGNLEKLCDRGERGKLQGSGDER
jgi:NTP pyrophosphatase (non-canonical NTP hydrolase)